MPKVSVVIPVHNTARFLDDCVGSLFAQTLPADQLEILAIDDGSTDDSLDVLHRLADGHPTMRVFHQDASGSAAAPRNKGIDEATGEYIFFLDSDDWLAPAALEVLVALADETGSGVVLPRIESVGSDEPVAATVVKKTQRAVDFIASGAYRTYGPEKLFRASIIRDHGLRFPTGYRIGEDIPFTLEAYFLSPHVSMAGDEPYCFVRWRADATSLRQSGQSAPEFLAKNEEIIRIIDKYCTDIDRRIPLLQRAVLLRGGMVSTFGGRFLVQFDPDEQRDVFERTHTLLQRVWKPEYRQGGSLGAYLSSTLIWLGDFEATVELSWMLRNKASIPILPAVGRQGPVYVASTGTRVADAYTGEQVRAQLAEQRRIEREKRQRSERRRKAVQSLLAAPAHPIRTVRDAAARLAGRPGDGARR